MPCASGRNSGKVSGKRAIERFRAKRCPWATVCSRSCSGLCDQSEAVGAERLSFFIFLNIHLSFID